MVSVHTKKKGWVERVTKPKKLKDETDEELREIIKKRILLRKEHEGKMNLVTESLRKMRSRHYTLSHAVTEARVTLGVRHGKKCPALVNERGRYGGVYPVCQARRFRFRSWGREHMYECHCYACHLTPKQAKTAMLYDKILLGKRNEEA